MEVIISIVGSLAAKAAEYTVNPTARQLSYLFNPRTKFLNLRSKVQDLKDARERLQQSVDSATRNGEVIFDDVQRWLTVANDKISEEAATQLQEDEEKATKRCFAGFCPDFKSSYQLSKKADKEANSIAQLLTQKDNFDGVSYPSHPKGVDIIRPVKEYEAFASRNGAFDRVMAALEDDAVSIIGVYGMGGVGKTTLVKEAAKQAKEKFDEVIFVAVTQTPNTVNIQNEIANQLGLELDKDTSVDVRAVRLRDRLMKAKKILVILDDLWKEHEVDKLGIPSADQHKGCKLLMTSRSLDVLKRMDSRPNISIETLKEDEAWNLFKKMAGHTIQRFGLQSIAVEVAKKCAGLPIAIATIAIALKPKEDLREWKDALRRLSKPSERNFKGIPADAYSAIEMSYKYLKREGLKYTFLLCSIMGHDAAIQDLLKHCRGLGLFHGLDTMEKVRNRVLVLVSELKDSSLLLAGSTPERFDMHDVVRDVAISIASRDHGWLALGKEDVFEEWSDEDTLRNCNLVSLSYAKVSELPDVLKCPHLNFFSMHSFGLEIPSNFFNGMQRLKVLNFTDMNLLSLPSSIGSLKTLCTLSLLGCDLEDIVILGELQNLEILDLRRSKIAMLPKEIGKLTRLKLLDLSYCSNLKVISPKVLSSLSRLEELYLYGSFDGWEVEGIDNTRSNASLVELQHLSHLTTLEVHIPDVKAIPKDNLFFGKMERYKISIGYEKWGLYYDREMETSKMLKIMINKSIHLVEETYKLLLRKTETLHLNRVEDIREMLYDPIAESFGPLKFIKVENCNMLKSLFSFSIAKRLRQLEKLEVSNCENIITLIVEKEEIGEDDILEFRKLCILKLDNLNRFNGSWYSESTSQSSTWLFDKKVSCPALKELYLDSVSGIEKIWHIDDQLPLRPFSVQCLTILKVKGCRKLKYVFISSMVKCFVHLKKLVVSKCHEMEGVIEGILASTEEGISSSIRVLPKLDSLELIWLSKLKRFCCGINPTEFPSLKSLKIYECPDLNTFAFDIEKSRTLLPHYLFNEKVILPVLEVLEIYKTDNLERLWPDILAQHSFSRLTSIDLSSCPKLLNVFPLSMLTRLQRLNSLSIWNCESLEEIIFGSQSQEGGSNSVMQSLSPQLVQSDVLTFEFPNLISLHLSHLPNLRSIHHKMHAINWPSLKKMEVSGCDKVEILFASQETSSHQPLFWVNESTFSNLQQLILGWNAGIKEMIFQQKHQLLSCYFCNLKVVKLEQVTIWPSYLFRLFSVPNLQTLEISYSSFKEMIFQSEEGGEEKPASLLLSHITELRLDYLLELRHLWKENEGFPNLKILHVGHCPELKVNLVPSSVSFRNLVTLEVRGCDGIIKLITYSTAKSLVQLKEMSIQTCKNIEEIIQGGDDDEDDEVSFPRLNSLKLEYLPKLESFCSSANYSFAFPSLEILVLHNCPKMKMRDSKTPLLHKVRLDKCGFEKRWDGNLNGTVQQLLRGKHAMIEECENSKEDQSKPSTSNTQMVTLTSRKI